MHVFQEIIEYLIFYLSGIHVILCDDDKLKINIKVNLKALSI